MSYEPTNWKTGDVVTSAKLNKLENGVANGSAMVVHKVAYEGELSDEYYQLDKTWQEITDAMRAGTIVMAINEKSGGITQNDIISTLVDQYEGSTYYICSFGTNDGCGTSSADGYPHMPIVEGKEPN